MMFATDMTQLQFFQDWTHSLRSGEFKQGRGALHTVLQGVPNSDLFCCLGVGCEIGVKNDLLSRQLIVKHDVYNYMSSENQRAITWSIMPDELSAWLRISYAEQRTLAQMNDAGQPFSVIAGWIEQNLMVRFEE
jgi:hypothetical protein